MNIEIKNEDTETPEEDFSDFGDSKDSGYDYEDDYPLARRGRVREDEDESAVGSRASNWAVNGVAYYPSEQTVKELPPGQYTIEFSSYRGPFFQKTKVNLDELVHLPDSASEEVIHGIENFWSREKHFRERSFLWKRGILLYGPPGSGKTSTLQIVSQKIIQRGGLSVYIKNPDVSASGLEIMRRIEPTRPIVIMIEDMDAIIHRYGESEVLALLDGELQIDNVVFIATTNYPEKLDKRLVNRPSRFDIVKKIDMPTLVARKIYLESKLPDKSQVDINRWAEDTDGFSIAHLKELIVSVDCLGNEYEDTIARLKAMMTQKISSDDDNKKQMGFSGSKVKAITNVDNS